MSEAAVVVTATIMLAVDPFSVTELGDILQAAPGGDPLQVKATVWLNPPLVETVSGKEAVCPAVTVIVDWLVGAIAKSCPVPDSVTI